MSTKIHVLLIVEPLQSRGDIYGVYSTRTIAVAAAAKYARDRGEHLSADDKQELHGQDNNFTRTDRGTDTTNFELETHDLIETMPEEDADLNLNMKFKWYDESGRGGKATTTLAAMLEEPDEDGRDDLSLHEWARTADDGDEWHDNSQRYICIGTE